MLEFLRERATFRKARLFACACARLAGDRAPAPARAAVEAAERYADGEATPEDLDRARDALEAAVAAGPQEVWACRAAAAASRRVTWSAALGFATGASPVSEPLPRAARAGLLHCLFGNPFRPAAVDPAWRTAVVLRLAGSIYAERAFDRLPVLADQLEEAGSTDARLLAHLRGPGPHALGCHALDAVLGKE
jgi:hypothetical protein